tara:strand:- start:7188 stop:8375 length:1188 start_codon:yes stop_codon:yes gene_type:complete
MKNPTKILSVFVSRNLPILSDVQYEGILDKINIANKDQFLRDISGLIQAEESGQVIDDLIALFKKIKDTWQKGYDVLYPQVNTDNLDAELKLLVCHISHRVVSENKKFDVIIEEYTWMEADQKARIRTRVSEFTKELEKAKTDSFSVTQGNVKAAFDTNSLFADLTSLGNLGSRSVSQNPSGPRSLSSGSADDENSDGHKVSNALLESNKPPADSPKSSEEFLSGTLPSFPPISQLIKLDFDNKVVKGAIGILKSKKSLDEDRAKNALQYSKFAGVTTIPNDDSKALEENNELVNDLEIAKLPDDVNSVNNDYGQVCSVQKQDAKVEDVEQILNYMLLFEGPLDINIPTEPEHVLTTVIYCLKKDKDNAKINSISYNGETYTDLDQLRPQRGLTR